MLETLRLKVIRATRNWFRVVRTAALVPALCWGTESLAIEKANLWRWDNYPLEATQWWTNRQGDPGDPHLILKFNAIATNSGTGSSGLDFEIGDLNAPSTHADLAGVLGDINDDAVYDNGTTRLETSISGASLILLEPPVVENNATNTAGTVTTDMAGHSLLINQGTYSYVEYDAANNPIASGSVDFAVTPLELDITSGSAVFSSSLTGSLSLSVMSGMSPSYFGSEDVMLMLSLQLDAQAVPEPTGLGAVLMPIAAAIFGRYRRRRKPV
jgi:hypothetical protein